MYAHGIPGFPLWAVKGVLQQDKAGSGGLGRFGAVKGGQA